MELDAIDKIKIIKSTKTKEDLIFKEEVFQECDNSEEVLRNLQLLQHNYANNPLYELVHGLRTHLSVCFRNIESEEIIRFYSTIE